MKITFFTIYLLCISGIAISQEINELSNMPGKWIYTNNNQSNEWYGERYYKMNAVELQKYHSTTEKLVNYLHQQPVAQHPIGVILNVQSRASYIHYDHELLSATNERVKAEVFIPFCHYFKSDGKIDYSCMEVSYVRVRTNDATAAFESAMNPDIIKDKKVMKQYNDIFILPKKLLDLGDGVFLYDFYYENRIIVKSNDRPLWLPITNYEYASRILAYEKAQLNEGDGLPQMVIDALKSEIADIPPEIMNMPAYINGNQQRPLTGICTMEEDSTNALYQMNPAYFDSALPRTSVQLITITIVGHADDPEYGGIGDHRIWEFISGMKGSDFKKLLDIN